MRGATPGCPPVFYDYAFQSTRPMRGATSLTKYGLVVNVFQSTRPMRGATGVEGSERTHLSISIHAPHAGRDLGLFGSEGESKYFNPRAPCGARLIRAVIHLT